MLKIGPKVTKMESLSNTHRKKRLAFKKELHKGLKEVRVNFKRVKVTAYEKDGVIGRFSVKSLKFYPLECFGVYRNGEHWYLNSRTLEEKKNETRTYRNIKPGEHLLASVKSRAKRTGLDFDLKNLDLPEKCPLLGRVLDYTYGVKRHDNRATVDRIDNSKGYTKDNTVVCSWRANRLKSDGTLEELKAIVTFIETHNKAK